MYFTCDIFLYVAYKYEVSLKMRKTLMTILFKYDVQVVMYVGELVSQAANHLKVCFWSVVHLIPKADSQIKYPP